MWRQPNIPAPNRQQTFSLKTFTGGLNNFATSPEQNCATDILNMEFRDEHAMAKRFGTTRADTTDMPYPITHLNTYRPYTDTDVPVRADKERILIGTHEKAVTRTDGMEALVEGVNYMGMYFYVYGEDIYVHAKGQAASTYVQVVGTPDTESRTWKIDAPPTTAVPLGTEHQQGVRIYNYNSSTISYVPCQNELEDASKGANVPPAYTSYIVTHKNRLFLSGNRRDDDNVFISDALNPFYFPVSLPIQIPPNSEEVVGMAIYDDGVVVSRTTDMYAITGDTNNKELGYELFKLRRLNTHVGFMNNRVAHFAHNYLFYLGADKKVYALSSVRSADKVLVTSVISNKLDLTAAPLAFTDAELKASVGVFHENMYYLSIGTRILVYSYLHTAWTVFDNLQVTSFERRGTALYMGDSEGHVVQFDKTTYLDKGKPFKARWASTWFDMGDTLSFKHFKEFIVLGQAYKDSSSDVRVGFEIDYAEQRHSYTVENKMSVWGVSAFGDRFITKHMNESYPLHIGARGRVIRITLENSYVETGKVQKLDELHVMTRMRDDDLVYVIDEKTWYLYRDLEFHGVNANEFNQPMSVLQISGDFEFRTKR